jgi:hypothetical protein
MVTLMVKLHDSKREKSLISSTGRVDRAVPSSCRVTRCTKLLQVAMTGVRNVLPVSEIHQTWHLGVVTMIFFLFFFFLQFLCMLGKHLSLSHTPALLFFFFKLF